MFSQNSKLSLFAVLLIYFSSSVFAQNRLENIEFSTLPGNKLQIAMSLSQAAAEPLSFTINDPARIAFDLLDTENALAQKSIPISVGVTSSIKTVEAGGKTRVVLNMSELVPYSTEVVGNNILVTIGSDSVQADNTRSLASTFNNNPTAITPRETVRALDAIDFRRGNKGEGRIIVDMSSPAIAVDINEDSGRLLVDFINAEMADEMIRRLDVIDFATPVRTIDAFRNGRNARLVINTTDTSFDHLAYQSDDIFTIEVKEVAPEVREQQIRDKFGYTGERLSLNFQDIEVRSVLQLIADFTNLNVVVSDSVVGQLTLRLKNVPWDQALDIILNSKGLDKRRSGNVLLIAPTEEIAAREKLELEAQQQVQELAPLRTEYIQINYAKAEEIAALLGSSGGGAPAAGAEGGEAASTSSGNTGILSSRGSVAVDSRTNTLIINDTLERIADIRLLVNTLDVPISQVLIESRIVIATDDFNKEIGVNLGVARDTTNTGGSGFVVTGSADAVTSLVNNETVNIADTYAVNLPASGTAGTSAGIALTLASLPFGTFLDLELSALQAEERGEIVSSPRVITSNQKEAVIEQGVEVAYISGDEIEFKEALLQLTVTPQITPDDRVIMDITVSNDTVGEFFGSVPTIDRRKVETQVLADNGETIVLGGIFEQITRESIDKVPFFGDLPILGNLFKRNITEDDKSELLIFITPKIIRDNIVIE